MGAAGSPNTARLRKGDKHSSRSVPSKRTAVPSKGTDLSQVRSVYHTIVSYKALKETRKDDDDNDDDDEFSVW